MAYIGVDGRMKLLRALIVFVLSCNCQQAGASVCMKPVANQTLTSCSALSAMDSEGLYNVRLAKDSVACLYCAKLASHRGWWYRFGKGGMSSTWNFAYEWQASATLDVLDQSDISTISLLNISQIEVRTDVRFEIRTSDSVNPSSVTVRFTPSLNQATVKIPRNSGGSNTGVCVVKFPFDSSLQYDGSKILCSNQGLNQKCGSGNLPPNGQTTQSLLVESVYIDPQGTGALARNGQWSRNAVYWDGGYYYVYVQETGRVVSVPATPPSSSSASSQQTAVATTQGLTSNPTVPATSPSSSSQQTAVATTQGLTSNPTASTSSSTQPTQTSTITSSSSFHTTSQPVTTQPAQTSSTSSPTETTPLPTTQNLPSHISTAPPSTKSLTTEFTVRIAFTTQPSRQQPTMGWESRLQNLAQTSVTDDTVVDLSFALSSLSQNTAKLNGASTQTVVDILERIVQNRYSNQTSVANNIVQTASSMLEIPSSTLWRNQQNATTSSRTLELLEHYVLSLTVSTDQTDIGFKSSNLVAHRIAIDSPHRYGYASYNYDFYSGTDDDFTDSSSVLGKNASTDSLPDVAVRIPRSVLLRADAAQNKTASTRRLPLVILVYRTDKLFSRKDQDNATHRINSNVVSVSFSGSSLTNLTEPITVTLEHTDKCGEDPRCVYWNSTESGGSWSEEGCAIRSISASHTECDCNHLTNFALLMNMDGPNRPICLGEADKLALSLITYVGCSLSLIGLVLTVITLTIFPQQLKTRPNKILINLCLALIGIIAVFLAGIDSTGNQAACKTVGVLIHYFILSALLWMGIEAFNLYLLLVLVFSRDITHFILKCSLVGWGIPAVIVAVTVGQSTDNYGGTAYCHVTSPASLIALVAPAALILLTNSIFFVLVVKAMYRSAKRHSVTKNDDPAARLRAAFSVLVLMGLTWAFGFLTVSFVSLVFQYLFAIFNTTQGFFIFIFYCLRRKDMRTQWLVFLRGGGRHSVSRANQMTQTRSRSMAVSNKKVSSSSLPTDTISVMNMPSGTTTRSTSISMLMPSDEAKNRKYSFKGMFGKFRKKEKEEINSVGNILHELHRLEGSGLSGIV